MQLHQSFAHVHIQTSEHVIVYIALEQQYHRLHWSLALKWASHYTLKHLNIHLRIVRCWSSGIIWTSEHVNIWLCTLVQLHQSFALQWASHYTHKHLDKHLSIVRFVAVGSSDASIIPNEVIVSHYSQRSNKHYMCMIINTTGCYSQQFDKHYTCVQSLIQ